MYFIASARKISDTPKNWYLLKGANDTRWVAYELSPKELASVLPDFAFRGPYKSLISCMIVAGCEFSFPFTKEFLMHIAEIIIHCRVELNNVESHFKTGHRGVAAESLCALGAYLRKEIPYMTTDSAPVSTDGSTPLAPADQSSPEKTSAEKPEGDNLASQDEQSSPEKTSAEKPEGDTQASQDEQSSPEKTSAEEPGLPPKPLPVK